MVGVRSVPPLILRGCPRAGHVRHYHPRPAARRWGEPDCSRTLIEVSMNAMDYAAPGTRTAMPNPVDVGIKVGDFVAIGMPLGMKNSTATYPQCFRENTIYGGWRWCLGAGNSCCKHKDK